MSQTPASQMTDRYFLDGSLCEPRICLHGAEAHHLTHVMRARPGDVVQVFDGHGWEATARVEHLGRSEVSLIVLERREVDRESTIEITIGVALPKGDRQRWLVEKLVELGATRLVPLSTAHSQDRHASATKGRLQRAIIEASKQCGRNRLMQIENPQELLAYLASRPDQTPGWIAHFTGRPMRDEPPPTDAIWLAIGPEGGFTEEEVAMASELGWKPVSLGSRILRVETAAVAMTAAIAFAAGR